MQANLNSPNLIIRSLHDACAQIDRLDGPTSLTICNAQGLIYTFKANGIHALVQAVGERYPSIIFSWVIDVEDDAAAAILLMKLGYRQLIYRGDPVIYQKLVTIMDQYGGQIHKNFA